jgi:dephospho-CoA kinase
MFVVGLTGGIGSGKTAASDYLASKGITVVDADLASRVIVQPGQPALARIAERFGADKLNTDGTLNRAALRTVVFADKQALKDLEAITHPAIRDELVRQLQAAQSPYVLLVSPLLLETNQHELVDRILLIDVPEDVQVARTAQRDQVAASQVKAIMDAQMPRQQRRGRADDIVVNDSTLDALHETLDRLHETYLASAGQP